MKKFVLITADGTPILTVAPASQASYAHGTYIDGLLCIEIPFDSSDTTILEESFWDGTTLRTRPPRPEFHVWDGDSKTWIPDLAEARRVRRLEINGEQERRNTLPIQYVGLWFEADAAAMRFILGIQTQLLTGVVLPPGFTWRTVTNAPHPADAAFVNGLGRAILLRSASLYQAAGQHKAAMLALTSVEDILAYDITVGW